MHFDPHPPPNPSICSTTAMPITILPLEEKDIPTFISIELAAFAPHPRIPMLWPQGYTPDLHAYMQARKNSSFSSPNTRMIKAVDTSTNEILGVSHYTLALDPEENRKKEPMKQDEPPPNDWPQDGNWEMKRWFDINSHYLPVESFPWQAHIRSYLSPSPSSPPYPLTPHLFTEIELLLIHPTHQNRGIGSQLLQFAIAEADRRGVPMGLESTPAGLGLYKRHGFREEKVIKADMRDFGWRGEYDPEAAKRVWMIRDAR